MISINDERLVELFFKAEKARITCEPIPYSETEYLVGSKSEPGKTYLVTVRPSVRGDVFTCVCQFGKPGELSACTHVALAAADFCEAFRLKIAAERDRRRLADLIAYRDGELSRRSLSAQIRALEARVAGFKAEPISPKLALDDPEY